MTASPLSAYTTVRTEGALLPADILARIASGDASLGGLDPASYHLDPSEKIGEATNRAWNRLQARWASFQGERAKLAPTDTGTSITRERWLLPLFEELKFGRLQLSSKVEIDGKSYAVSHAWQHVPIHLVGCQVDLDRRVVVAGTQRSSPHSFLQELLNRGLGYLWGIVSNGLRLRLLRDNISLTRQAYVEFDLEGMMAGEAYPDFVALWLLLHQSRFEGERPEVCQLEKWSQAARTEGVRVLEGLRDGVQKAIEHLGQGFLAHSSNTGLREKLRLGALDKQDYYRQLLRLVYRLLFLFVAEDRDLLLAPTADPAAKKRYRDYYATTRLRRLANLHVGSRHHDLYCGLTLVMDKLSADGYPELALPALGSFLFSSRALPDLNNCEISNLPLLEAVRSLAVTYAGQSRRVVDYKNLGAEELGSVYESLLELHPELNAEAASFELKVAAGSERKKTGSYYTPTSLISCLLDSALDPVLTEAAKQPDAERAILKLKVVDPACGSGHFLIAAAHRIAKSLAGARTGEEEPPPDAQRKALRDVIGHCIYGVDVNPMAVELCKVSLWMEALEPGKPLSFLEHRIQCGNSLLGAIPALLEAGIPDGAFTELTGDSAEAARKWKRVNRNEREARANTQERFGFDDPWIKLGNFAQALTVLDAMDDTTINAIHEKERQWREAVESSEYVDGKLLADSWCAAFVWKKDSLTEFPVTEDIFREIELNPHAFASGRPAMYEEVRRLARSYGFFHWHLTFPEVFCLEASSANAGNQKTGWNGGFDVVLGNPPWEQSELKEKEWFARRNPEIAAAEGKRRKDMIAGLRVSDPALWDAYVTALRDLDCENVLLRSTGRYPLCGVGRMNTYAVFAENDRNLLATRGRMGVIVPSGIATDNTTKDFFAALIEENRLVSLYDFENAVSMFQGVGHGRFKFCLLTVAGAPLTDSHSADFFFYAHYTDDLKEESRHFTLTAEEIGLINPNTRTCPIFRSKRDAEITKGIYRRVPVLINEMTHENHWQVTFKQGLFNMTSDSGLFRAVEQLEQDGWSLEGNIFHRDGERYLPLYEAKMMHQFTHRYGDYAMRPKGSEDTELPRIPTARLADPSYVVMPRYWVSEWDVIKSISQVPRALVKAVEAQSEDMVRAVLGPWLAGYALNHGNKQGGNELLIRLGGIWKSMPEALGDWLVAKNLESTYPLDEDDLDVLQGCQSLVEAAEKMLSKRVPEWLFVFRRITNATNERTVLAAVIPPYGAGDPLPIATVRSPRPELLLASMNTVAFDYTARQKIGGTHLDFHYAKQLPVLPPSAYTDEHRGFIAPRVLELIHTACDVAPFARDLSDDGPPFLWHEERRFLIRAELDALYFHLYGIGAEDASYILDTFPIVRRNDEKKYGEYRTKRVVLEIYEAMAAAERTGIPYQTRLDPPAADPRAAHSVRKP